MKRVWDFDPDHLLTDAECEAFSRQLARWNLARPMRVIFGGGSVGGEPSEESRS